MIFPVIARRLKNKDLYTVSVHQGLDPAFYYSTGPANRDILPGMVATESRQHLTRSNSVNRPLSHEEKNHAEICYRARYTGYRIG